MDAASTHKIAQRARSMFEAGMQRLALDILEAELLRSPDEGALWRLRGVLLHCAGQLEAAYDNIERAMVLVPLGPRELVILADAYASRGHLESAAGIYVELARGPVNLDLWQAIYDGLCRTGHCYGALQLSRRIVRNYPEDDAAYYAMAHALLRLGRPPALAVAILNKAIGLNPDEPRYRVSMAVQLMQLGRGDEAQACVSQISDAALNGLTCRCCLDKLLQLAIKHGNAARASTLAARLAQLSAAVAPAAHNAKDRK